MKNEFNIFLFIKRVNISIDFVATLLQYRTLYAQTQSKADSREKY